MIYPAATSENLAVLKLSFVNSSLDEEQLASAVHFTVSHFALVTSPHGWSAKILRSI
jgi:hypothetical protein